MNRFTLHQDASQDIDGILVYLDSLSKGPAFRIGRQLESALHLIAAYPLIGAREETYSELSGFEIRWLVSGDFKILYRADLPLPDILAVLHGKRDIVTIMQQRLR